MIRYIVDCEDNDTYAFRDYPALASVQQAHQQLIPNMTGNPHLGHVRCKQCGELLTKWDEQLRGVIVKKRNFDIAGTYDGVIVVSSSFRSVYDEKGLFGLVFRQLPDDPIFFSIQALRVVPFDSDRRQTRFVKRCSLCGSYESVVGATPVFLKSDSNIGQQEFVRTDLEFGSGDEKHPVLLCGEQAGRTLSAGNLKGLDLIPF